MSDTTANGPDLDFDAKPIDNQDSSCNLVARITQEYSDLRKLRSPESPCSFAEFEASRTSDNPAFLSFRKGLTNFLKVFLPANGIPFPDLGPSGARNFKIKAENKVISIF